METTVCRPPMCCKDSHMNAFSRTFCSECIPGYFGPNCTLPCRFPNYGLLCQSACACNETDCNHRTGCPTPTVGSVSNDMSMKRNHSGFPQNVKIFYVSNLHFTSNLRITSMKVSGSFWNNLSIRYKVMFVSSICIIVMVFLTLTSRFLTTKRWKYTVLSFYC
uniref:Platelet endothelial aggregation receptor 1-like n=1 Tax=Crassostrea virginica TaxID=6565 RepID=A0A8B8ALV5_CRAVI|nr:platelet endothelial aggregation receptor 1-like [Crassostrea virginica]